MIPLVRILTSLSAYIPIYGQMKMCITDEFHAQLPLHTSVLIYHTTVPVCNLGGPPPGFMVSSYLPTYTSRYVRARCASRTLCFSHFVFVGSGVREFGSASGLYHGSGTDCVILYRSFVPHFVECLRALFCFLPSQLFVPAVCA